MSKNRSKGTAAETAIVRYLADNGFPGAERRALHGNLDRGDITGLGPVVIECKSVARIELASIADETAAETRNARADVGAAWIKRRGTTDPGRWYALLDGATFTRLLRQAGYGDPLEAEEEKMPGKPSGNAVGGRTALGGLPVPGRASAALTDEVLGGAA